MAFPVEEKFIEKAELELNITFPSWFKERMIKNNGGVIEADEDVWEIYPFFDTSDKKRIKRTANHIVKENEAANEWEGFPKTAVAIGSNGTGDLLVLLRKENNNKASQEGVYIWRHETNTLESSAT